MEEVTKAYQSGYNLLVTDRALIFCKGYFIKMGWIKQLPDVDSHRRDLLTSFFMQLTYKNPYHPRDLPFNYVIPKFFEDCICGSVEEVFPSEHSHLKAFKTWIVYNLRRLRSEYAAKNNLQYDPEQIGQLHAYPRIKLQLVSQTA